MVSFVGFVDVVMDAKPEAGAEGSELYRREHKALDAAPHLVPVVHDHAVEHDGDDRPYCVVDCL